MLKRARAAQSKAITQRRESEKRIQEQIGLIQTQITITNWVQSGGRNRRIGNQWVGTDQNGVWLGARINARGRNRGEQVRVRPVDPSKIPQLKDRMEDLQLQLREKQIKNTLTNKSLIPVNLLVGSSRRRTNNNRAIRSARSEFLQEREQDKQRQREIFELNNELFDVQEKLREKRGEQKIGEKGRPLKPFILLSDNEKISRVKKQTGFDIQRQIGLTKQNFGTEISVNDVIDANGSLIPEAVELFNRNNNSFEFKSDSEKAQILKQKSGFDVIKQLEKSNQRFNLNLSLKDVTKNTFEGGLLDEAKTLFERNRRIDELKTQIPDNVVQTVPLDENSDFDTLFGRHSSVAQQQQQKIKEIEAINDKDLKIARIEKEIPQFTARATYISGLIKNLEKRVGDIRSTRTPENLVSASGLLKSHKLGDLVERRNQLAKFRNEKTDIFNSITDPALRQVTLEQDIPLLDARIGELDQDIEKSVKFAESREQLGLGLENVQIKGKRAPKEFTVTVGDTRQKFRRTRRGAKQAELFFQKQRGKKLRELESIEDPIEKAVAKEQDIAVLDLGLKATKAQKKQLKAEERARRSQTFGAVGSVGFLPFTPSDTPTGSTQIQAVPKSRGVPTVFGALDFNSERGALDFNSERGRRSRVDPNNFDIGNLFGARSRSKIPKKQRGGFDFF